MESISLQIPANKGLLLEGDLLIPEKAQSLVIFAHGAGSSRLSPRNRYVAQYLGDASIATLLFDLLTLEEERGVVDFRFNIELLTQRLICVIDWIREQKQWKKIPICLFGASTGAAAALCAAARLPSEVQAVVSRGGRPDLAEKMLGNVLCPTLLLVGQKDEIVVRLNEDARRLMKCHAEIHIIPHATHLFEEEGALEQVAQLAKKWFLQYLA